MILGTDGSNRVVMVGGGTDPSTMPTEFNGSVITAHVLTKEQRTAFGSLPADRGGTLFDGAVFTSQPAAPEPKPNQVVTMRQARLALMEAGLLGQIDAAVASIGGAAAVEWEYSTNVERNWPLVASLAASLNLSDAQLDALFTRAAQL